MWRAWCCSSLMQSISEMNNQKCIWVGEEGLGWYFVPYLLPQTLESQQDKKRLRDRVVIDLDKIKLNPAPELVRIHRNETIHCRDLTWAQQVFIQVTSMGLWHLIMSEDMVRFSLLKITGSLQWSSSSFLSANPTAQHCSDSSLLRACERVHHIIPFPV